MPRAGRAAGIAGPCPLHQGIVLHQRRRAAVDQHERAVRQLGEVHVVHSAPVRAAHDPLTVQLPVDLLGERSGHL
jgi:hypothetical protein